MIPDYTATNPYQVNLAAGLQDIGIRVTLGGVLRSSRPISDLMEFGGRHDIIHIHWIDPFVRSGSNNVDLKNAYSLVRDLVFCALHGSKIVLTIHNLIGHDSNSPKLEIAIQTLLASISSRIIIHCESARHELELCYRWAPIIKSKIRVINHGSFIRNYRNTITKDEARTRLSIPPEKTVLLFFGQIRAYKGLGELLDCFSSLHDPRLALLIAGKPSPDPVTRELLNRCRAVPGAQVYPSFVPDDEVQLYMNACDAVVLPYRSVLTSGAALLAMSFGRAVIAPRLGCVGELLAGGGGILYDPGSSRALTDALRKALDLDLDAAGARNYGIARGLDWSGVALRTAAVYNSALGRRWPPARLGPVDEPVLRIDATSVALSRLLAALGADRRAGCQLILVDDGEYPFGASTLSPHRVLPFLEKDGQYWGPPADDDTAVQELERLRARGAEYLVFARSAFWWLEYYRRFRNYVFSTYGLVRSDERFLAFSLTGTSVDRRVL
jgi:glycosyltransferase involved in cell wall biosynthesis